MHPSSNTEKILLIAVVILIGLNAGQGAWMLCRAEGGSAPTAIRYSCGAFVTAVLFSCALIGFWYGLPGLSM